MLPKLFSAQSAKFFLLLSVVVAPSLAYGSDWTVPSPQELSMTSEPTVPDAAAVYLFREEIADDQLHMHSVYVRLKILTEEGKKYADVEIPYEKRTFSIGSVAGRTIHSDGSIVPFTGKPYDKMLEKTATYRYQAKVFSMPDVQVGSILEYRYQLRYDDHSLVPPTWYVQQELYVHKAHYRFLPFQGDITTSHGGREQVVSTLQWYPILPRGAEIKHTAPPVINVLNSQLHDHYDLDIDDVPPEPKEDYLPPIHSFTYRVYFLYSPYKSRDDFWTKEGKWWSKESDKFMTAGPAVNAVVAKVTTASDTPDQKLQKLYNEVMSYENTNFTRERSQTEDKAEGLRNVKTADDVVERKRGSSDELTMVFISMARAAGMKAYLMRAVSRRKEMFNLNLPSLSQLDSPVAIVNLGGKDRFFDPGERYCTLGQLRWDHTGVTGLRQTDGGTEIAQTPEASYTEAKTIRVAKLTMDEKGSVTGTVQMGYNGDPALEWRQIGLRHDEEEVKHQMEDELRRMLPGGLTVKLDKLLYLDDPSKQLITGFQVNGQLAMGSSKRMFVPLSIFASSEKPLFTQAKRQMPVYFDHGFQNVDQVSLTYPASMEVESVPQLEDVKMKSLAVMREGSEIKGNTVTLTRNFAMGSEIFKVEEYEELRNFYSKVNHKDQEQAVLKVGSHAAGN